MTDLAEKIADLTPEKRAWLASQLRTLRTKPLANLPCAPRDYDLPISWQQEKWVQLARDRAELITPSAQIFGLEGHLNVEALERSVTELVARHSILRTRFVALGGVTRQSIGVPSRVIIPLIDLESSRDTNGETEVVRRLVAEVLRPFDRARDVLLRPQLFRLGPDRFVLSIIMDHIASDGWSCGLMNRELSQLYRASLAQLPPKLSPLPFQYGDYAYWQRESLQGRALQDLLEYWKDRFEAYGAHDQQLPTDRRRPSQRTFRGTYVERDLPPVVCRALRELCRSAKTTLFNTLLAGLLLWLRCWTGRDKLTVMTSTLGRTMPGSDLLVGPFAHAVALCFDVTGVAYPRELVARVHTVCAGAMAHVGISAHVLSELIGKGLDVSPISFYLTSDQGFGGLDIPDVKARPLGVGTGLIHNDMIVSVTEHGASLSLVLGGRSDLFEEETLSVCASDLARTLERLSTDPERRLLIRSEGATHVQGL